MRLLKFGLLVVQSTRVKPGLQLAEQILQRCTVAVGQSLERIAVFQDIGGHTVAHQAQTDKTDMFSHAYPPKTSFAGAG